MFRLIMRKIKKNNCYSHFMWNIEDLPEQIENIHFFAHHHPANELDE